MEQQLKTYSEPAREIPVRNEVDVLVVGAGPAGIMAAQAAALVKGTKVMLIDSRGYLGGNMTIGLPLLGFLGRKGNEIIKGLPLQFVERLRERGQATHHRACPLHVSLTMVDPEGTKRLAWEIMEECGVKVLLYVFCADVIMEGNKCRGVIIESKRGREAILAKTVVDCTGDGDVLYRAGAEMLYGNEDGNAQPPTLMFSMRGVDSRKLRDAVADHPEEYDIDFIPNEFFRPMDNCTFVGFRNQIRKAREAGYKIPVERTIFMTGMAEDEWWVNMSRVNGIDATDPEQYTKGEEICIEQNAEIIKYLKAYIPGFENAYLDKVAPFMGIRETRRLVGLYTLTEQDIFVCAHFEDAIGVASYPVDLHHPVGGDCSLYWCPDCYDIPYRSLIPKKVDGVIAAGRDISATHLALASVRVMGPAMCIGEAAGKAAAIAARDGIELRDMDIRCLQDALRQEGVYFRD
ncbi:MAG: FAD-dependent oxidoreductase [Candidatus Cryptobacteroides sp.]